MGHKTETTSPKRASHNQALEILVILVAIAAVGAYFFLTFYGRYIDNGILCRAPESDAGGHQPAFQQH